MAKTASLNIRIDPEMKADAEELFGMFGITVADAVNIFLHQSLLVGGLPFAVEQPRYNAETEAAMRECDEMLASGNFVSYGSAKELHEAIMAEDDDV
jgi:DNA-damage-inducible protein J